MDSWSPHRMVWIGVGFGFEVRFGVERALKNVHSYPLPTERDIFHWNLTPKIQRLSLQKNSQQLDSSNLEHSWTQIKAPAKRPSHLQGWLFYADAKPQSAGTRHGGGSETCNCLQDYFIFILLFLLLYYYLWEREQNIRLMMLSQLTELCPSRQGASNEWPG